MRDESFATFFDEHSDPVLRALTVAFREPRIVEEATREAFVRAYSKWAPGRPAEPSAAALFVTASRDALRRGSSGESARERQLASTSEPDTLERAIEELGVRERLALVLHHHAGLSPDELGRALRCSRAAAMSTLREAHRRLGVERDDDDDIPEVELDAP